MKITPQSIKYTLHTTMEAPNSNNEHVIQVKEPKRVIHCSDGVLEEYSDDETDAMPTSVVDTKTLDWMPWIMHYVYSGANKALEYCDTVGEGLADFLGITTPKYQLELSEFERMQAEKREEESHQWNLPNENATELITFQPTMNAEMNKIV